MDDGGRRLFEEGNQARMSGDYERARPLLEDAVRACPEAAERWWALGHVLLNIGEFESSISRFEKAVELEPSNQRLALDLAKSLQMLGEYEQAKPLLERIIEVDSKTAEAEEARKSLSYY